MKQLTRVMKQFISKYLINVLFLITLTILFLIIMVLGIVLGYQINLIPTIMCGSLLFYGWMFLFRFLRKFN